MSVTWRVLDTGVNDAATNMCLDRAILEARSKDLVPDTLRFLMFSPPAVLIGYHQSVEQEVRVDYCRAHGIDINRRITGGGAIFFDETQIGWELIAGKDSMHGDMITLSESLCQGVIEALATFGVEARFRPVNDVEVAGRKISGTGGTESDGALLFQGTLLVDFDVETMLRSLRIPTEKLRDKEVGSVRERVTCLNWLLGSTPDNATIKGALVEGFETALGIETRPADLTPWERDFLTTNLASFQSDEWVHRIRRPLRDDRFLYSVHKAPGGLIRTSILLDDARGVIKYAMLTGDFFAFPESTVLDLEAALKNCPVVRVEDRITGFFEERRPEMPGVTPEDFVRAIGAAVRKRDLAALGLSPGEASSIHEVNDALEHLGEATVVLLPYCAKMVGCDLRYDEDCIECGGCTVGVAYELARRNGMEPITIVNFEHLQAVLDEMRRSGVSAYLGCCCEPFFAKHWAELEAAGISGLLVDIEHTTCYELDQEREAKAGQFTGETSLNVDLLKKLFAGENAGPSGPNGPPALETQSEEAIKRGKGDRRPLYTTESGQEGSP
jgi:lipoate-protein ligase A